MSLFDVTVTSGLERIAERAKGLGAYVTTLTDHALAHAEARAAETPRSLLHGVPYGLKDEWDTAGIPTTAGSYRHRDRTPSASCEVHQTFEEAGAILVGKTNLSDMGLAPEASSYVGGVCRNPWDLTRTAGGSSGGAAAAVADGMQAFDWGTDIGGSIRMPAGFCGVLGLRLSAETWPIEDLFPGVPKKLDWMCGQGPIAKTTDQMRAILDVAAPRLQKGTARAFSLKGAVIHEPDELGQWPTFAEDVAPHVAAAIDGAIASEHGLPGTTAIRNAYSAVWASHFDDVQAADTTLSLREGMRGVLSAVFRRGRNGDRRFHPTTAELLMLIAIGRHTIYRNREKALRNAETIRSLYGELWDRGMLVVAPVCAFPAPKVGKLNRNLHILSCTMPGNISDATGIAIPFGRFPDGLPRSVQFMGPPGSERLLLDIADRFIASRDADSDSPAGPDLGLSAGPQAST
jgi:amidase